MSNPDISIEGLVVRAGGRVILNLPHSTVAPGEVLGVVGPNGAGKTTLLRVCLGLRPPVAGRVTVLGQPVFAPPANRDTHRPARLSGGALTRLRQQIGYVPQELPGHSQMPLTVREVVAIGRTGIAGLLHPLRAGDWEIIDDWIERLGLGRLRDAPFSQLSGGEQRKTVLARAMVQKPRLLLLDEPTAHLDPLWRRQIVATLDQLYDQTRTSVILVSHDWELLPTCCRRVVLLANGQILAEGAPQQILNPERLAALSP